MPAATAKSILVKFKDDAGSPVLQTVAGLRSRQIQMNAETVDITSASSTGNWRELLDGTGVRSVTISGEGVFYDDTGLEAVRDAFFENEQRDMEFFATEFGTFAGKFQVTSLQIGGEYNREVTFSATFESTGVITFTSA